MAFAKTSNLRQIATFQVVARLGSVSHAAEELHLTQSAVSIQIAALEESVGAPLLTRTGRGVRLTEAGNLLLSYANRLLSLWTETSDAMEAFRGSFTGTLRIGAVTTAEHWLPGLLVTFIAENPRVQVKLTTGNRDEMVRHLEAEEIDLAVMGAPPDDLKVSAIAFAKNPMAFVAAPSHPLMSQEPLTMAMLAESNLLVRERGSGSRTTVTRLFKEAGLHLRIGSELSSNEAIKQMCMAGFGPAYLSMHTCLLEMKAGLLALLPLPGNPVERQWFVVHLPSRHINHLAIDFAAFLAKRGQSEIDALLQRRDSAIEAATGRQPRRARQR